MIRSRQFSVTIAISLAAALTLSGVTALAETPHASVHSSVVPSAAAEVRRLVTWTGLPTKAPRSFLIDSSSIGAPSPDVYQIQYGNGSFSLYYQRAKGGPITSQFTITFQGLVEWNDTHGDGHLEDGSIVAYIPLGPGAFGRYPIQHTNLTTADGIGVNSFRIVSNRGDVALNLTISDGFLTLPSSQTLTPMEAKLTLDIYHNMTLPSHRLALQISLSTNQRVMLENRSWDDMNEFSSDDRALNVTNEAGPTSSSAFFSWSNSASVNGIDGPVTPTVPEDNSTTGDYDFFLSYPVASGVQVHVVHDPAVGVVSAAYASIVHPGPGAPLPFVADALVYGISLAGIAALVGGTAFLVSRRRRKAP